MGGFGSGRQFGSDCTDQYISIDVRRWQREGLLKEGNYFNCRWSSNGEDRANIGVKVNERSVKLFYCTLEFNSERENHEYSIQLLTTPCYYGGDRLWFRCPALGCERRVAILYGGKIFACRHCYQLAYRSQRETLDERLIRQAEKIRNKLGWVPGILNGNGWKPRGMHWETYSSLVSKHDICINQSLLSVARQLKLEI